MNHVKEAYAIDEVLNKFYVEEFNGDEGVLNATAIPKIKQKLQAWKMRGNTIPGNNTNDEIVSKLFTLVKWVG